MNKIAEKQEKPAISTPETGEKEVNITRKELNFIWNLLRFTLGLLLVLAGFDKFTHVIVEWHDYLSPYFTETIGIASHPFMYGVGTVEVIIGVMVIAKPKIGAWLMLAMMSLIIFNLLTTDRFYDIALRDFVIAMAAIVLARISKMRLKIER